MKGLSVGDEFVAAFVIWDRAAARIGQAAEAAIAAGRRPARLSGAALQHEAERLTAAERALGLPLGWCRRIAALRWPPDPARRLGPREAAETVVAEHHAGALRDRLQRVG